MKDSTSEHFLFAVGYPHQHGASFYTYFNEIHYGPIEHAERFLDYVKSKSPDKPWQIYKCSELNQGPICK